MTWAQTLVAPGQFALQDVEPPVTAHLSGDEVIVDLVAGATCASDLPAFRGTSRGARSAIGQPGRPLHEIVARIVEPGATPWQRGQTAVGWASGFNGLQERFITRSTVLAPVRSHADLSEAIGVQVAAVVLALADRVPTFADKRVAVIGLGATGLLLGAVAHLRGARSVVGIDRVDRRSDAEGFGFDEVIHASSGTWADSLTDRDRPDIVIEAAGHQSGSYGDAIRAAAPRGGVFLFGAPDDEWMAVPLSQVWAKQLLVTGGPAADKGYWLKVGQEFVDAQPQLARRLITSTTPFTAAQDAFDAASHPRTGQLKQLILADHAAPLA